MIYVTVYDSTLIDTYLQEFKHFSECMCAECTTQKSQMLRTIRLLTYKPPDAQGGFFVGVYWGESLFLAQKNTRN